MRLPHSRLALAILWLGGVCLPCTAQDPIAASSSDTQLQLTLHYTDNGTVEKDGQGRVEKGPNGKPIPDYINEFGLYRAGGELAEIVSEYATKISTYKYSNRELLWDLQRCGVIASIDGWAIKKLQATLWDDEGGLRTVQSGPVRFYLVHLDPARAPIALDDVVFYDTSAGARKIADRFSIQYADDVETGRKRSYTSLIKQKMYLVFDFEAYLPAEQDRFLYMDGTYTGSEKLVFTSPDRIPVLVSLAAKLSNISGQYFFHDETEERPLSDVAEGSVSFAAGKILLDLQGYPGLAPAPD